MSSFEEVGNELSNKVIWVYCNCVRDCIGFNPGDANCVPRSQASFSIRNWIGSGVLE
jgi:hypothetical protein